MNAGFPYVLGILTVVKTGILVLWRGEVYILRYACRFVEAYLPLSNFPK